MNVLSLFDGMSCGQIAFDKLGIKFDGVENKYLASEIEKNAIKVTQHNYPNTIQLGDVTKWRDWDLPEIDFLIGGSPCQGFSFAGKQLNFEDSRSKLFFEFVDILKAVKPKYFMLENVRMKREYQDIISDYLGVEPININSSLVSAQNRNRFYWTNIPNVKQPIDRMITFDNIDTNCENWLSHERIEKTRKWKAQQKPLKNAVIKNGSMKVPCLTARGFNQNHSGMILIEDGEEYRLLTRQEAEMCQTIPLNYTKIATEREAARMIGNGWTVDVIAHILKNAVQEYL